MVATGQYYGTGKEQKWSPIHLKSVVHLNGGWVKLYILLKLIQTWGCIHIESYLISNSS